MIIGAFLVFVGALAVGGVAGIVLAIMGFRTPKFFLGQAWSVINLLFPTAIRIGKLLDIEKENGRAFFH